MDTLNKNSGLIFIIGLPLIAVILWFMAPGTKIDFSSTLGVIVPLGYIFGIIGFILFCINIILSARLPILERLFYGLNKVYEYHGILGKLGFYFMLLHPLMFFILFAKSQKPTLFSTINFFTPTLDKGPVSFGIIAFWMFIILVILTLWFRPKYHIWKWTHKLMGLALFFGALHAFFVGGTMASYLPLKYYTLLIFSLSIGVYIYHTVLGKFLIQKYKYIISQVRVLGNVTEITLQPIGKKMAFNSGQFAFISFRDKSISKESHPFSLTSVSSEESISFNMKNLGDYTSTLPNLTIGVLALIEGPFGKFSYKEARNKNQIWIAGGIGITPFLSMLKEVIQEKNYSIDLYYCLKNEKEAVHLDELKNTTSGNVRIFTHYSETQGFVNADTIEGQSGGLKDKDMFLCAPPQMIHTLKTQFLKKGMPKDLLHSEEFKL